MKQLIAIVLFACIFQFIINIQVRKNTAKSSLSSLMKQKELTTNQFLESKNKEYIARMQDDGNFVLYSKGASNGRGKDNPTWASNTDRKGKGPYRVAMQEDGNLVLYDADNKPTWASNTNGKGTGPYRVVMQDDGNLVVYDSKDSPIWASNTYRKK